MPSQSIMKNAPWCAETSGVSSLMIRRDTASRFFWPCIIELNLARLVFSQSCSVFFCVVSRRLTIIWLMLSLSDATSPWASTVIDRVRSPLVTAVATSEMARTCVVRLPASWLTLSVSSRQVPAAPGTLAWPPSLPFDADLARHRVTCSAKVRSVSVMLLMVSASAAISPLASTPISFCVRSPLATAVTTLTMPRTWSVRFEAMKFTLSVRSFQVPATPGTRAWPPSFPSMPTSRATVVTCSANVRQRVGHGVDGVGERGDLALGLDDDFCFRSPLATAVTTLTMPRTCAVRLRAMKLTLSVRFFQTPATPGTSAWPPSLPSVPTSFATRVTSRGEACSADRPSC